MFHAGLEREHVVHTLQTGEHLRYRSEAEVDDPPILVDSLYNLRSSRWGPPRRRTAGGTILFGFASGRDIDPLALSWYCENNVERKSMRSSTFAPVLVIAALACTRPAPTPPSTEPTTLPPRLHEDLFSGRPVETADRLETSLERWRTSRRTPPSSSELRRHRYFLARRERERELVRFAADANDSRPVDNATDLEELLVGGIEPTDEQVLAAHAVVSSQRDGLLLQLEEARPTDSTELVHARLRERFTREGASHPTRHFAPDELPPTARAWALAAGAGEISDAVVVGDVVRFYRRLIRPPLTDEAVHDLARSHALRKAQVRHRAERLRDLEDHDELGTPLEDAYVEYRTRLAHRGTKERR